MESMDLEERDVNRGLTSAAKLLIESDIIPGALHINVTRAASATYKPSHQQLLVIEQLKFHTLHLAAV